ncbi:MAG: 2-C-methyl-D-erythritol 4-phosphate cytidylyltransferase [Candidatus Lernaella stagnicola]|nr:2-C-methyl-D-erythritol 4-phosphate cytidylyltransferase [Candidatus Lernaella stagnicola]
MLTVAIVVAGGRGRRMRTDQAKQYIELEGKSILQRSLEAVAAADLVDQIILVVPRGDVVFCRDTLVDRGNLDKMVRVAMGGKNRQESVAKGLAAIEKLGLLPDVVVVHDGVRPFVDPKLIDKSVRIAANFGGALVAVPVTDTIKVITDDGFIRQTPDRRWLFSAQTPQAFQYHTLVDAHRKAEADGFVGTDDCQLVERVGGQIVIVEGDERNIKITTPHDLLVARALLKGVRR